MATQMAPTDRNMTPLRMAKLVGDPTGKQVRIIKWLSDGEAIMMVDILQAPNAKYACYMFNTHRLILQPGETLSIELVQE